MSIQLRYYENNWPFIEAVMDKFERLGILPHTLPNAIGMWPNEQECLVWTVSQCAPEKDWLEIGSFCGGSSVLLGLARQCMRAEGNVIAVDKAFNPMFDYNVGRSGVADQIVKVQCDSSKLLQHYNDLISFAFIDGFHSFKQVIHDFEAINGIIDEGGVIAFHDVSPKMYTHDHYYLSELHNGVLHSWESLMSSTEEDFMIDQAIAYICITYDYEIIDIPIRQNIKYFKETRLTEWVRGQTSPFNSFTAIRKKQ